MFIALRLTWCMSPRIPVIIPSVSGQIITRNSQRQQTIFRYSLYKKRLSDSPESHRQTVALFKFGGLTWREDFYKSWRFFIGLTVFRWLFNNIPREFFSYLGLTKRRLKNGLRLTSLGVLQTVYSVADILCHDFFAAQRLGEKND